MQVETDQGEIIEWVAALDVGKAEVVCCARVPGPGGQRMREVRTISTMTAALLALGDRLAELGVSRVVMEATSDYWRAPLYLLEDASRPGWSTPTAVQLTCAEGLNDKLRSGPTTRCTVDLGV